MKKLIGVAALSFMCGSAFAQSTGAPAAAQTDMIKPGTTGEKGSMHKGTTGSNKKGMKNDNMMQGGTSKDGMGQQNKGGMSK
jgi:hypothetical protein